MGRYILLAIVSFLLLALGIFGFFLWKYASIGNLASPINKIVSQDDIKNIQHTLQNSWIKDLAVLGKKEYILPTNEIFIEYKQPIKQRVLKTYYQLFIDKNDIYSMFCLMQTLRNIPVDFTVVKNNTKSQIFLNTQDSKLLERIITELRTYDIHSKVLEVKL